MIALLNPGPSPAAVSTVTVVAIEVGVVDEEETVALVVGRADPVAEDASKAAVSQNNAHQQINSPVTLCEWRGCFIYRVFSLRAIIRIRSVCLSEHCWCGS